MKTLVLTNHLHSYAGSEILAIDVAKCFRKLEYQSYISANVIDQNFKNIIYYITSIWFYFNNYILFDIG